MYREALSDLLRLLIGLSLLTGQHCVTSGQRAREVIQNKLRKFESQGGEGLNENHKPWWLLNIIFTCTTNGLGRSTMEAIQENLPVLLTTRKKSNGMHERYSLVVSPAQSNSELALNVLLKTSEHA